MKVLIAEDHPMFRDGLAALLSGRPDITQVQAVANGADAVAAAEGDPPDVAVVVSPSSSSRFVPDDGGGGGRASCSSQWRIRVAVSSSA